MQRATACPHCLGRELQLEATRQVTAHVLFTGAGDEDDAEVQHENTHDLDWDDQTPTTCTNCGHTDALGKFITQVARLR